MSEEKKPREVIIFGEGTKAELEAKKKRIESGEELLPDGTRYPDQNDLDVKILWDVITRDPFSPEFFKGPKQLLDITLRPLDQEDLLLPLTPGTTRQEIEVAINGGFNSIDLTFDEKRILHAVQAAFSDAGLKQGHYPEKITLTRAALYDLLGVGWITRPDGSRYRAEAMGYQRKRIERTLLGLSDKPFPFVFKMRTGLDKKGESIWTVALTRAPIIKVAKIYEQVEDRELPGIRRQDKEGEKRF